MRGLLAIVGVAVLTGCSSATPPLVCHKTDRHGVYSLEFAETSGDCGAIPSSLVNFDNPAATAGCTTAGESWSENNCKFTTSASCPTSDSVGSTTQETADGSLLTGTISIHVLDPNGCRSTYDVKYTRK